MPLFGRKTDHENSVYGKLLEPPRDALGNATHRDEEGNAQPDPNAVLIVEYMKKHDDIAIEQSKVVSTDSSFLRTNPERELAPIELENLYEAQDKLTIVFDRFSSALFANFGEFVSEIEHQSIERRQTRRGQTVYAVSFTARCATTPFPFSGAQAENIIRATHHYGSLRTSRRTEDSVGGILNPAKEFRKAQLVSRWTFSAELSDDELMELLSGEISNLDSVAAQRAAAYERGMSEYDLAVQALRNSDMPGAKKVWEQVKTRKPKTPPRVTGSEMDESIVSELIRYLAATDIFIHLPQKKRSKNADQRNIDSQQTSQLVFTSLEPREHKLHLTQRVKFDISKLAELFFEPEIVRIEHQSGNRPTLGGNPSWDRVNYPELFKESGRLLVTMYNAIFN